MTDSKKPSAKSNDSECWNCVGVSVLSEMLAKKGEKPICYGIQYKASVRISDEAMKKLEDAPTLPPKSTIFLFGLSQSSARMHRHGQIPLVKYGFRLTATYKVEESQNQTSNEKIDATQKQLEPETPLDSKQLPAKNRPIAIPSQNQPEVKPSMTETSIRRIPPPSDTLVFVKFSNLIQTSSMKLWSNTCKISQTLPARLQKSAERVKISISKRLNITWMRLQQRLIGDDSTRRK